MDDAEEIARLQTEKQILLELAAAQATEEGVRLLSNPAIIPARIVGGIIMQEDGKTPMAGTAPDGSATIADLVAEHVVKYPMMFRGDGRGGGGAHGGGGSAMARKAHYLTRAEFDKLDPGERMAAVRSGRQIVD